MGLASFITAAMAEAVALAAKGSYAQIDRDKVKIIDLPETEKEQVRCGNKLCAHHKLGFCILNTATCDFVKVHND
jgi:hypothetical protein